MGAIKQKSHAACSLVLGGDGLSCERMDSRALKRMSGPSWRAMRPIFDQVSSMLLSVSPTAKGELTTIYIKFVSQETKGRPYAVLWVKKASEMVLGLALPETDTSPHFVPAPKGCKYAGLTKYVELCTADSLPPDMIDWARSAFANVAGMAQH